MPSNQIPEDVRAELRFKIERMCSASGDMIIDTIAPLIIGWARKDIFDALDGKGIEFDYGTTSRGQVLSIGGIRAFLPETWGELAWQGEKWENLTPEQRFESAKFSAQHALVKKLAELRAQFTPETTGGKTNG